MLTCIHTLVLGVDFQMLPVKTYVDEYSFVHAGALDHELAYHHHTPLVKCKPS